MGESWPRTPVQTERSEVCTSDRGQDSPIQNDLAWLIRCLLYGQTRNQKGQKNKNLFVSLRGLSLQSKRDKSPALQNNRFIRAQWKSLWLNNNLWKVTKSATNFNACLCLHRSAISSHLALRSSPNHHRKRWCWMCSLRTCQYALWQKLPELDLLDCEDILMCCGGSTDFSWFSSDWADVLGPRFKTADIYCCCFRDAECSCRSFSNFITAKLCNEFWLNV